jgi:hypothetical protein
MSPAAFVLARKFLSGVLFCAPVPDFASPKSLNDTKANISEFSHYFFWKSC